MNTRDLTGAVLVWMVAALAPVNGLHAQGTGNAQGGGSAQGAGGAPVTAGAPVAGQAVLGVTIAEQRLVATGYRASRLLKQEVYNDKGEKIGAIDDLVIAPDGTLSIAVINVGGFLGMANHRVAIPVRQFTHIAPKAILPNASKDQLKALPKFEYA